ncbi:MAG: hypothetical protein WB392_14470 [Methanotrichaceae archaeon]
MKDNAEYFSIGWHGNDGPYVYFREYPLHGYHEINGYRQTPFDFLSIKPEVFVEKANKLFNKYNIKIPDDYPNPEEFKVKSSLNKDTNSYPWHEFILCIYSCIILDERYNVESVSKIIKKELIKANSRKGVLHACTLSIMALKFLNDSHKVEIPNEKKDKKNPDLIIDGFRCDIKVVQEFDWTGEALKELKESFLITGNGKQHELANDICYDIGEFVKKRLQEGAEQADIIIADLLIKRPGFIEMLPKEVINEHMFPRLKNNRIIFILRDSSNIFNIFGYYVDFDPVAWKIITTNKNRYKMQIIPPPVQTSRAAKSLIFQDLIDAVESLPLDDQSMLVEIINNRIIEKRRVEPVVEVKEAQEAFERGEFRQGTVKDLMKDLED